MKTEEDEAFDELAKKQGDWGGGFQAKRRMAADKLQEPAGERAWFTIAELNAWADKKLAENPQWVMPTDEPEREALAQPAQEPIYNITVFDNAHPKGIPLEDWVQPAQRPWVGLTAEEIASISLNEYTLQTVERLLKGKNNGT